MIEIESITFACNDVDRQAEFWSAALDGTRRPLPESIDSVLIERPGDTPNLLFKEQPKGTERDLPIHLDLATEHRTETVERLCALGGAVRETKSETVGNQESTWTVMEDPEGNGFCVSEYTIEI